MVSRIAYHRSAERPSLRLWLQDDDGDLIDFSTGYTFTLKIGPTGGTALLTKTTGITGAAGSSDIPNVTVDWTAGELDLTPKSYTWELTARTGSLDRVFSGPIQIMHTVA